MSVGIAHHREVAYHAANICRWLSQNVLLPRLVRDPINFFTRVALKPEVIETRFDFFLNNDQNENRIFSGRSRRPEPNIMAAIRAGGRGRSKDHKRKYRNQSSDRGR